LIVALRLATAATHQAVELLPGMVRLTGPDPSPADYRRYLRLMARVYGTLEPSLYAALSAPGAPGTGAAGQPPSARAADRVAALGLRPKFPALCADLAVHGLAPPAVVPDLLSPPDLNTALGGLYVLEGSTLGGRVVARHLRKHLGDPLPGATFLDFHGGQAAAHWKRLGLALDGLAADGLIDPDCVITGACAVFQEVYTMLATLDEDPPAP
jgi:heme oxygenase